MPFPLPLSYSRPVKNIVLLALVFVIKAEAQTSAFTTADSLYMLGDYTQAINTYAQVGSQQSALQIARAYNAIGNFDKSVAQYEGILKEHPTLQIARFELGKLYLKTKQAEKGKSLFEKLSEENNDNPEYLYYLAESLQWLKKTDESVLAYQKAVGLDSTHLRSLFQLGKYYVAQKEKDSALTYVDMGLRFYEKDVALINLKALAYYNNDEFGKAAPWFERLLELGERKEYIYYKLAICQYHMWEFEKAKTNYHVLLDIDDSNPDYYFNLGHVFFKDRMLDSAQYYIKLSKEVQEVNFAREYESLARIAAVQEKPEESIKYYKLSLKEDPDNMRVFYQVCFLSDQHLKDPKVKLEYYESFIKKFGNEQRYFSEMVSKRIKELKQEIHFGSN
ncbi:Flp pilus assembly protein TadD, contains TPR repeats [Kriegella aquimaris]|uniref:Flp pilus assembly protein TadD, contains TPR repeats n=1 Tax=Kriegella aquimaris TaxID=192904 RepID=A0A1G9U0Z1_9FLAO|nr:Flp pilus assembly protein TadD, contains TPR repeats [Kriegella aquimaris]